MQWQILQETQRTSNLSSEISCAPFIVFPSVLAGHEQKTMKTCQATRDVLAATVYTAVHSELKMQLNPGLGKILLLQRISFWYQLTNAFRKTAVATKPPHLHLTTSKVMVIVWRLRGNIIKTVLYIANVLPLQWAQLTKTVHTARLGLEFVFSCF